MTAMVMHESIRHKGATKTPVHAAQRGKKITVKVTANRTGHTSGRVTSKPTSTVAR
jgi:hypothetical protein